MMLSWEYPPVLVGGLGRHVHALCTSLAAAGDEVTVVSRHTEGAAYDEVRDGVRVIRMPEDPLALTFSHDLLAWSMGLNHALARAALRVATDTRPDLVHAHDWLVAHAAVAVKQHLGLPLVATLHATEAGRHQGWLPEPMNRAIHSVEWWLTYEARRVITCSSYMRWEVTRLFDLPPEKVEVIPNGVDAARWKARPAAAARARARYAGDGPLLLFTGRLVYEKGAQDLLAALPRLRRRHPGLRLVVAGTGPYLDDLRALARQRRLGRAVEFAGFLGEPELAALVAAADCLVVPSRYEPFGLVAVEAAAAGTPVVAADVGGLRDLVEDGVTGLRFPAGDPAALAEAVSTVLTDELGAQRLVRTARSRLGDYAWDQIAARTATVYARADRQERALRAEHVPPMRLELRDGNLLTGAPN
jgi:glycogen(starch) synthase